jgi:hypothetical protein
MHVQNSFHLADSVWRGALLPQGALCRQKSTGEMFFVVRPFPSAVLCWEAEQLEINFFDYKKDAKRLQFRLVADLGDFEVIPTMYTAPLRAYLLDYVQTQGIRHHVKGAPVSVIEAQCDVGFACVPEAILKKVAVLLGCGLLEGQEDLEDRLLSIVSILKHVRPTATTSTVHKALARGWQLEHPDQDALWGVDSEIILEVVTGPEARDVKAYCNDITAMKAKHAAHINMRKQLVSKHFKEPERPRRKVTAAPRWYPTASAGTGAVTDFITKNLPAEARRVQDDANGRWLITYPLRAPKSVSWTKRGFATGASLALFTAWSYHRECTGESPPWRFADLEQEARQQLEA